MSPQHLILQKRRQLNALLLAIAACVAFFLFSQVRIIGDTGSALFGGKVLESVFSGPIWGTEMASQILRYAMTQLSLHALLGTACWVMGNISALAWPRAKATLNQWSLLWSVAAIMWLLVANATMYRWSRLGEPYHELAIRQVMGFPLLTWASLLLALFAAFTVALAIVRSIATSAPRRVTRTVAISGASVALLSGMALVAHRQEPAVPAHEPATPDVILIGIDSLRVAEISEELTPNLAAFLREATVFRDTTTPLARTFPAWVSLITGRHPHSTGALVNLLPRELIDEGVTLPRALKARGYSSTYAIDEVRFSNLDESYGFDQRISPPIGATDFLLGFFADSPLSNLLTNTFAGRWLFPYGYANRAAAITYEPDTFIERLSAELPTGGPLFLATHLTLAHWPYGWSDSNFKSDSSSTPIPEMYREALNRADRQFGEFVRLLESKQRLRNALVVIVSDHGEGLGEDSDLILHKQHRDEFPFNLGSPYGHGTSVLSPHQYKVLLAFRAYGHAKSLLRGPERLDYPASLEDVTPTVLELLGHSNAAGYDGVSLAGLLDRHALADASSMPRRIRFTETEFNPRGIVPGTQIKGSAIVGAAAYYRVDSVTDRLELKTSLFEEMMRSRQYAALEGQRQLIALPRNDDQGFEYLIVEREGEEPKRLRDVPAPELSGFEDLWTALHSRFSGELGTAQSLLQYGQELSLTAQTGQ